MTINISVPKTTIEAQLKPRISVIGVGGAGGNAVNNMIQSSMEGCDFIVANTDAQALALSRTDRRIQLGRDTTQGLGAGAQPIIGRDSAEEALEIIARELDGSHMAFITAGMGGGTGTGAAPVIARIARELGILTVGVVTKPFHFEGVHRMRLAEAGIEELAGVVDTLIIIPNQNLFRVANEKTTFADAFKMADNVLHGGVRSVTDLMMMPGMINLDFADVRTVMKEMGRAMMGTGEASGERRALDAAEAAIANPLLEDTSMKGAKGVLINITGGSDITLFEVDEAANRIREEVEGEAHIIFGSCFNESMEGKIRVSVVATGIESAAGVQPRPMSQRTETRAVGRRMPEIRTSAAPAAAPAPTMRAPAAPVAAAPAPVAAAPAPAAPAPTLAASLAPVQTSFAGFGGPTLAPATGAVDLQAEEQALMEMAAAVRAELQAAAPAPEVMPEPVMAAPVAPAPIAAQAAAVAEAVARAPAAAAPRMNIAPRDVFIPKAAVEPRMEFRMDSDRAEMVTAAAPAPAPVEAAPAPAPAAAKPAEGRVSLFGRYRSLTARPKVEETKAPEPQAKAPAGLNISVGPMDRPVSSHDEDELEIPAFLRRQAN
ncbi:MAG: cell division protein FtsZ [Rhodospirillaceae bacterium]